MKSEATVEEYDIMDLVGYYTIRLEGKALTETEEFFERVAAYDEITDELERFVTLMEKIGYDTGAEVNSFRPEGLCVALPPKYDENQRVNISLRLYCYQISENVVVLFNGDKKTAPTAQKCPNCRTHHSNGMSWANKLRNTNIETEYTIIKNLEDIILYY